MHLKEIAKQNYAWVEDMGWHNKTPLEALALIASEVGEAVNECRGTTPTEHLGEELADILLRVVDLAHWQGIDIEAKVIEKMAKNQIRGNRGRLK
ncbi:MazG nucleotide pyrophosphohydrolase domain-containing protein [Thalassotalea aquiviva]|uniref:MazG nucleotide pyrophosphohydrolase domain-containing protein n=1 Tax=Thalassotalea aquiviva TaxID=3242415 RepID=UPI003529E8ED